MRHLVLGGGGHAHLAVLAALRGGHPPDVAVTLVAPTTSQIYSGMLPGWMAGHYALDECMIDLRKLAGVANVNFIEDRLVGADADGRLLALAGGAHLRYDLLSLNVGSETDTSWLNAAGPRLLPIRPLDRFAKRWPEVFHAALQQPDFRLAIVGGGAAAVELSLAAAYSFRRFGASARIVLASGRGGPLPGFPVRGRRLARQALHDLGVQLLEGPAVAADAGLLLPDGATVAADCIVAATGAVPAQWLRSSGLACDASGFVVVEPSYRSVSHRDVFAVGDVCTRSDRRLDRSGVHAVRAGPALAENLLAYLGGQPLKAHRLRPRSLYLLATGPKNAIGRWGPFNASGGWLWAWKDRIDRSFLARNSVGDGNSSQWRVAT